ncbi:autotransporter domain-containing protein [Noviherbaspirillum cavernae]|uniref:Autotransporter domain-containing protein n=1 Tax=Noviherbaspirillum cavernae TaxID=2320862 RepID=A0A418WZ70_9BURK|nr:autotransporter domain-containing protein [Noviherbaspirillum cavernae]RJG05393.1 autotransporter domain-containing protein [Noviherbaspirillum cavernae]
MNHIYRLVWNKKRNMLVAVAEVASSQGKDANGETTSTGVKKQGREESGKCAHLTGKTSLLGAAILSIFPLVSLAQAPVPHYNDGYLTLSDGDGSNATAANWALTNDGILDISNTNSGSSLQSLGGSGGVILGDMTLTLSNANDTFVGSLSGSGGLAITGGTEILSGNNDYIGVTTIGTNSVLGLSGSGAIAHSFGLDNNGIFDISATNAGASIQSLSGSGAVILGGQTLTLTNASGTFAGSLSGSGGLAITGGTEVLSEINSYTGATNIGQGGTLVLAGNGSIADSSGVANNGTFNIAATAGGASVQSLSGSGAVILGGQTLTLTNASGTFAGSLSGSGGLAITGGIETLSGNNTYTGGTTVANGAILKVSSNANLGAPSSALTLNDGTLQANGNITMARDITLTNSGTFDVGNTFTVTNTSSASGSGTLIKNGGGTLILGGSVSNSGGVQVNQGTLGLNGNNTYTGGTTINGGTVKVGADNNLGAVSSNVTLNGGRLQTTASFTSDRDLAITSQNGAIDTVGADNTLTWTGNLSGSGRLTKEGDGTLILGGDNAGGQGSGNTVGSGWTGGLTLNGGLVKVTNSYGLGWGTVIWNGGTIQATVDILTGQNLAVGLGTGIDTAANTTTTLSGNIVSTGGGSGCFTKTGLGTLNVAGNAAFNSTCVLAGRLLANGSLDSMVTVEQGGTLGGSGVINGPVLVRGTLSPGNSPGMLTANSTVTMAPGSTFKEDIAGTQQASASTPIGVTGYYSYLHVTGNNQFVIQPGVTLAPALKNIFSVGEAGYGSTPFVPSIGQGYRIITADGGISGRFDTLAQPDGLAADTRMAVFYNVGGSNSIDLKVLPLSYSAWLKGANANSRSAAAALDQITDLEQSGTGSTAQSQLLYVAASQNAGTLSNFVKGLSGEVHGALAAATPQAGWAVQNIVGKHLADSQGAGANRNTDRALWIDLNGNHGNWSGDDTASGFSANRTQFTLGADVLETAGARLGFGFSHANSNVSADMGSGSVKQNMGFVYGQYGWNGFIVDGLASYGRDNAESNRADPTASAPVLATNADGNSSLIGIGLRAPWQFNGATYEPFARLTFQRVKRDAANEGSASAAALGLNGFSSTGTRLVAGLAGASGKTDPLATRYTYKFSVGVGVDGGDLSRVSQQATLAGVATTISAPNVGRVFLQGGVTGTMQLNRQSYVYLGLTGEARSGYTDIGGNVGVRVSF